jgi:hypothetical protein
MPARTLTSCLLNPGFPVLFLQSSDFLLNSFVLLGLAVEAGTLNQATPYKEEAAELERPDAGFHRTEWRRPRWLRRCVEPQAGRS